MALGAFACVSVLLQSSASSFLLLRGGDQKVFTLAMKELS